MNHRYPDPEVTAVYRAIYERLLETLGRDRRRPMADLVFQDTWGRAAPAP